MWQFREGILGSWGRGGGGVSSGKNFGWGWVDQFREGTFGGVDGSVQGRNFGWG